MKNRLKINSICIGLLSLSCAMFMSCGNEEVYDFSGDSQNRVYLKSALNTVNGLDKASFLVTKTSTSVVSNMKMKFPVFSTLKANTSIEVNMLMDNSIVDKYNAINGTTFETLPDGMLTFVNQMATIFPDATMSKDSVEVTVDSEKVKSLPTGKYLVSLAIANVKGEGVSVSSNRNMTYIMLEVKEDADNIWDITPDASVRGTLLTESRLDWTASFANITMADDIKKGFDGDEYSYFFCRIDSYDDNTGFVLDMQKEYSKLSGIQKNFYGGSYAIKESDVYTSKNGTDWTFQGKYKNPGNQYSEIIFYAPVEARYLKFIVRSASSSSYLYVRELNVYTK